MAHAANNITHLNLTQLAFAGAAGFHLAVQLGDRPPRSGERGLGAVAVLAGVHASLDDLVMAMSTELLGLTPAQLAATMQRNLEQISRTIGADRGYVLKSDVDGRSGGAVFEEWWAPGVDRVNTPIAELPLEAQRFWFRCLRSGETVHADEIEELQSRCPEAEEVLRGDGVRSILFVPLMAGDQAVGFLGFESRRASKVWDRDMISRVRTVGELIVAAVERCASDIERATAARDLAARNADLERSNRELQQFAAVVSHDLSQPLIVVEGFLEILRSMTTADAGAVGDASQYAEAAQRATRRMRSLITDVLDLARAGTPVGSPEEVDLGDIVDQVRDDLSALISEANATVTHESLPVVEGSPTQLRQLFQNLVSNSIKFRRPDRQPTVQISARASASSIDVVVSDNGLGIPAEERESVFEMFVRGDHREPSGMGIGLAVCARVVANHHGRIRLDESDGGGCSVTVTLPLKQPVPTDG